MPLLSGFVLLLGAQLLGEVMVRLFQWPLPGPVLGMVLMLLLLLHRQQVPDSVNQCAQGLLSHLSLLFVPAGVGVLVIADRLLDDGVAILLAVVLSTVVAIGVGAWCTERIIRWQEKKS